MKHDRLILSGMAVAALILGLYGSGGAPTIIREETPPAGGGSGYADSLRTADGQYDADLWLDDAGQFDTTWIADTLWREFVANWSTGGGSGVTLMTFMWYAASDEGSSGHNGAGGYGYLNHVTNLPPINGKGVQTNVMDDAGAVDEAIGLYYYAADSISGDCGSFSSIEYTLIGYSNEASATVTLSCYVWSWDRGVDWDNQDWMGGTDDWDTFVDDSTNAPKVFTAPGNSYTEFVCKDTVAISSTDLTLECLGVAVRRMNDTSGNCYVQNITYRFLP